MILAVASRQIYDPVFFKYISFMYFIIIQRIIYIERY
jgi:hypothetical protein